MEISRYASRLAPSSAVLPSGRPLRSGQKSVDLQSKASLPCLKRPEDSQVRFPKTLPEEPDDAQLTGGTRSLSRRLLALNIPSASAVSSPTLNGGSKFLTKASGTIKPAARKSMIQKPVPSSSGMVA